MRYNEFIGLVVEVLRGFYNNHSTYQLINLSTKIVILFVLLVSQVFAFDLDTSVDDEIRRNYNPSALENNLPALPKVSPTQAPLKTTTPPKTQPVLEPSKPQIGVKKLPSSQNYDKSTAIRIPKGTKFKVRSSAYLSDTTRVGARFTFTTLQPVTKRYVTIPVGTVFDAVVINSHPPQITGNGGLLEIGLEGVRVNGRNYYAQGKVTKANGKKIFVNNIKGKRQYWKGVANQIDKGEKFYKKTRRTSAKLSDNPVGLIIAPVPTLVGMGVYAVNFVGSPIFSIGSKGGKLSIPAGTQFEIKLLDDVYLE